jgi:hypothetical protein
MDLEYYFEKKFFNENIYFVNLVNSILKINFFIPGKTVNREIKLLSVSSIIRYFLKDPLYPIFNFLFGFTLL